MSKYSTSYLDYYLINGLMLQISAQSALRVGLGRSAGPGFDSRSYRTILICFISFKRFCYENYQQWSHFISAYPARLCRSQQAGIFEPRLLCQNIWHIDNIFYFEKSLANVFLFVEKKLNYFVATPDEIPQVTLLQMLANQVGQCSLHTCPPVGASLPPAPWTRLRLMLFNRQKN